MTTASASRIATLAGALALIAACDPPAGAATPPAREPDIRGMVTAVQLSGRDTAGAAATGTVHVEGPATGQGSAARVVARITERTRVLHRASGVGRAGDLREGLEVSIWYEGPVAESFPLQATADAIVIETQ